MNSNTIKNIHKGDRKAFRWVFDEYFNALAAFGYNYLGDALVAEDMAQEALISFWEKRTSFDHLLAVKSFLYTSVRNKCLNYLKHEKVKRKHEPSLKYDLELDDDFTDHVLEEEVFNRLFQLIKDLPKASADIMLLALNGMKNAEIADELGVSINTVKTQKKIAYAKIKDKIGPLMRAVLVLLLFG